VKHRCPTKRPAGGSDRRGWRSRGRCVSLPIGCRGAGRSRRSKEAWGISRGFESSALGSRFINRRLGYYRNGQPNR
jgi:hypothetical protein